MTGDIDFEQFNIDSHFTKFGPVIVTLLSLSKAFGCKKTIETLSVWQKIQELPIGSGTNHFQ